MVVIERVARRMNVPGTAAFPDALVVFVGLAGAMITETVDVKAVG
jgi:hypothetical protein